MITSFFSTLFSRMGLYIIIYVLIGIFVNTASPHIPSHNTGDLLVTAHSWIQYLISIMFWPLSFWHPTFTVNKWHP